MSTSESPAASSPWRIQATVLQTPTPDRLDVQTDVTFEIDGDRISRADHVAQEPASGIDVELPADWVLVPGLLDTHLHAPQWPQRGTGLDLPLDKWLFEYTFPLEARFGDVDFARRVWSDMVPALLAGGTTTAVYYGSIHEPATVALAEHCVAHGQRAFIGRVAMDHPDGTPEFYRDADASASVDASARIIDLIRSLPGAAGLVEPMITPRFIPACSDAALAGHGELAEATGVRVQTHCSEGDWEHQHVLDRCGVTDAEALDGFGLLRDHTVLAHATHLLDDDRVRLVARGAGVAHCPLSNSYFANAVFPTRRNLDAGVRVGLGTDIAGGSTSSMFGQCEHAVTVSRMLEDGVDVTAARDRGVGGSRIDAITAFHLATAGGAELLGIDAGLLVPGSLFDAVAIDIGPGGGLGIDRDLDDWPRIFEKIVRNTDRRAIRAVWVGGRLASGTLTS